MRKICLSLLLIIQSFEWCRAQNDIPVSLPSVFADHMVLQQNTSVNIWGWGEPNSTVKIVGGWSVRDTVSTLVSPFGNWKVSIATGKSGGPYTLQVFGSNNKIILNDILLGEVWLCSGQSNMVWMPVYGLKNREEEVAKASHPNIRIFNVYKRASSSKQDCCFGQWDVCTPDIMQKRSAVAYFFARSLTDSLKVPVGIIVSAWGGSLIEAWTPTEIIKENIDFYNYRLRSKYASQTLKDGVMYNQMIHPLLPYTFAGAIWYQGEANTSNPHYYGKLLKSMIESWRETAGRCFPFYLVQIAPYLYHSKNQGPALIREAQEWVVDHVPETGLVVISDCVDNLSTIHPENKCPVGKRLADLALIKHYKVADRICESPLLRQAEIKQDKIILTFSSVKNGLVCEGKEIKGLKIAGADGVFVEAKAKINSKNQLVVFSPEVEIPVFVRYCFDDATVGNLFNKEGLPVAPFRTDEISSNDNWLR